jgi:hypothetical protein
MGNEESSLKTLKYRHYCIHPRHLHEVSAASHPSQFKLGSGSGSATIHDFGNRLQSMPELSGIDFKRAFAGEPIIVAY